MTIDMNTVRLLGAVQLFVFAAGLLSEQLLKSAVGSGDIPSMLVNISNNLSRMRFSNLVALLNCLAIIALGTLFYITLNGQNKTLALVALGFFLAEAITLAVSKIGTFALVPLSQEFVAAGAPEQPHLQALGNFLYNGIDRRGYDIHMLFFCLGGILWYYLLHSSGKIPALISIWGLAAISLLTIPVVLALLDREYLPAMILGLPYAPYELVLGLWLVITGFN